MNRGGRWFTSTKQFVTATLLALALLIVASTPLSGQQSSTYDPWLDYNEDGRIDASDLTSLSQVYGASGDTAKNVTIVRHATKLIKAAVDVSLPPSTTWDSGLIPIDGYSKVTVLVSFQIFTMSNFVELDAYDESGLSGPRWIVEYSLVNSAYWVKTYDVMNQQIRIMCKNNNSVDNIINVDVYLLA